MACRWLSGYEAASIAAHGLVLDDTIDRFFSSCLLERIDLIQGEEKDVRTCEFDR